MSHMAMFRRREDIIMARRHYLSYSVCGKIWHAIVQKIFLTFA
jgi:hypothetical protein